MAFFWAWSFLERSAICACIARLWRPAARKICLSRSSSLRNRPEFATLLGPFCSSAVQCFELVTSVDKKLMASIMKSAINIPSTQQKFCFLCISSAQQCAKTSFLSPSLQKLKLFHSFLEFDTASSLSSADSIRPCLVNLEVMCRSISDVKSRLYTAFVRRTIIPSYMNLLPIETWPIFCTTLYK